MSKILSLLSFLIFVQLQAQTSTLQTADSLFALGNYSKAIQYYQAHDKPDEVNEKIARAFEAVGNYAEAIQHYKYAVNNNPQDMFVKYQYGKLLTRLKKYNDAKTVFLELIISDAENPNYHYELAQLYEKTGDTLSIPTYQKVFQIDNNHQKTIFKLARYHLVKRAHDSVSFYVEKGLTNYPENVELISLKAQNFYWKEQYSNAVTWFEKLLALGEPSEGVHEKLSFCYVQNADYDLAIEQLKLALQYNPKNTDNIFRLGTLYKKNNDYPNAEKYMDLALSMMDVPLDNEYRELATVYNHQKKYKEAIETLNLAVRENPENEYAHFILAFTKDRYYADIDSKINVYEQLLVKFPEGRFKPMVEKRLSELKKEQFLNEE